MTTVLATILDNRIAVKAEFEDKDLCKSVLGARWAKTEKAWTYPATVDTCYRLREVFGARLKVLRPLAEWLAVAKAAADAQAARANLSDAELTVLPEVAPRLAATLRPDQRAGARFVAEGYFGSALVADQPGLGKTMLTIAGLIEAEVAGPILVVCPKVAVRPVWWRELTAWTTESVHIARGTRAQREKALEEFVADPSPRKWLVIVAEMLRVQEELDPKDPAGKRTRICGYEYPDLFGIRWGAVVVDESHKTFGSLTVVKGNLMGKGLKALSLADGARKVAISGTPFGKGGRVQGMFGTLMWLWPKEFTSFWRWAETHFEVEDVYIGRGKTAKKVGGLRTGDGEGFLRSLGPRILRRTKAETLTYLPPKRYVRVWCEMGTAQLRQYKSLNADAEVVTPGGVLAANGVLAELTRAKQIANGVVSYDGDKVSFTGESCKIDALMQALEERGIGKADETTTDLKVVIASQFNEFLDVVCAALTRQGIAYHRLDGSTPDRERDRIMTDFQENPSGARVFVLNSKAGGVSITLDAADEMHMLDEMWNPDDNEQLEDRIHRARRVHNVTIYQYTTEGTIDERIANDVEGKRLNQFAVLDGRRGLSYVRDLIDYRPSTVAKGGAA